MIVSVKNNRYIMGQLMGYIYIYIYYNGIYHEIFSLADGLIWWMFFSCCMPVMTTWDDADGDCIFLFEDIFFVFKQDGKKTNSR